VADKAAQDTVELELQADLVVVAVVVVEQAEPVQQDKEMQAEAVRVVAALIILDLVAVVAVLAQSVLLPVVVPPAMAELGYPVLSPVL
jgi:hypothetical protein